jgi:hypothetical protein
MHIERKQLQRSDAFEPNKTKKIRLLNVVLCLLYGTIIHSAQHNHSLRLNREIVYICLRCNHYGSTY